MSAPRQCVVSVTQALPHSRLPCLLFLSLWSPHSVAGNPLPVSSSPERSLHNLVWHNLFFIIFQGLSGFSFCCCFCNCILYIPGSWGSWGTFQVPPCFFGFTCSFSFWRLLPSHRPGLWAKILSSNLSLPWDLTSRCFSSSMGNDCFLEMVTQKGQGLSHPLLSLWKRLVSISHDFLKPFYL